MSTLTVSGLAVQYGFGRHAHAAVDDVSLSVPSGRTLGLVGESGSGKSSVAAAIVGLAPVTAGSVELDGVDILGRSPESRAAQRRIQLVFQDPFSALDPLMPVGASIAEATRATGRRWSRTDSERRVAELLRRVHIDPGRASEPPSSFSGGQRQRITIARALAGEPRVLIADEITSALDVSVQGVILNLLRELQEELGLTVLFISHNLAVVRYVSHEIAVMQNGRVVESGDAEAVLERPADAYTAELLHAVPVLGRRLDLD